MASLTRYAFDTTMTNLEPCPMLIGGDWLQPKAAGTPVFNPSIGEVIAECPAGTAADVHAAVAAAQAAFPAWMETPPVERARILGRFKMLLVNHFEEIVRCNTRTSTARRSTNHAAT